MTHVSAGRVGRAHGRDGSFYVEQPTHPLPEGFAVRIGDRDHRIERRAGTDDRPLIRVDGVADRDAAIALAGEVVTIAEAESPIAEDEFLVEDLVGCEIDGLGAVTRVLDGPSCDVLEVGDEGVLIPLIRDAVKQVDLDRRIIVVDRDFLDL